MTDQVVGTGDRMVGISDRMFSERLIGCRRNRRSNAPGIRTWRSDLMLSKASAPASESCGLPRSTEIHAWKAPAPAALLSTRFYRSVESVLKCALDARVARDAERTDHVIQHDNVRGPDRRSCGRPGLPHPTRTHARSAAAPARLRAAALDTFVVALPTRPERAAPIFAFVMSG